MADKKTSKQVKPKPASSSEPKKSNAKWWILGGCGCLVAITIIALLIVGVITYFGVQAIKAPVGPIKGQLEALNNKDYSKAYNNYCSKSFMKATSFTQFKQIAEKNPQIFESKSSSFSNVNIQSSGATIKGTITGKDGTVTKMKYLLVKEDDKWKILRFEKDTGFDSDDSSNNSNEY